MRLFAMKEERVTEMTVLELEQKIRYFQKDTVLVPFELNQLAILLQLQHHKTIAPFEPFLTVEELAAKMNHPEITPYFLGSVIEYKTNDDWRNVLKRYNIV